IPNCLWIHRIEALKCIEEVEHSCWMFFLQEGRIGRPLCRRSSDDLMLARISFPFIPRAKASHFRKFIDEFVFIARLKLIDLLRPAIEKLLRERKSLVTSIDFGKSRRAREKIVQKQAVRAVQRQARLHNFTRCHLANFGVRVCLRRFKCHASQRQKLRWLERWECVSDIALDGHIQWSVKQKASKPGNYREGHSCDRFLGISLLFKLSDISGDGANSRFATLR